MGSLLSLPVVFLLSTLGDYLHTCRFVHEYISIACLHLFSYIYMYIYIDLDR